MKWIHLEMRKKANTKWEAFFTQARTPEKKLKMKFKLKLKIVHLKEWDSRIEDCKMYPLKKGINGLQVAAVEFVKQSVSPQVHILFLKGNNKETKK